MCKLEKPKYSLLESVKNGHIAICDECGRELMHYHAVRNNETNETLTLGSGCVLKYCGKTPSKINKENLDYEAEQAELRKQEQHERIREVHVSSFAEVEADVWEYIQANAEKNLFLDSMKNLIQDQGTIPVNALKAIKVMMIPFKQMNKGDELEGTYEILSINAYVEEERYSTRADVTMWVKVNDEKIKVKTTYSKTNADFVEKIIGILKYENPKAVGNSFCGVTSIELKYYPDPQEYFIDVKGKFDGWKVNRAKITFA